MASPNPVMSLGLRQSDTLGNDILQLNWPSFSGYNNLEITTFDTKRPVTLVCSGLDRSNHKLDLAVALRASLLQLVEQDMQSVVPLPPLAPDDPAAAPGRMEIVSKPSPKHRQSLANLHLDSIAQIWKDALLNPMSGRDCLHPSRTSTSGSSGPPSPSMPPAVASVLANTQGYIINETRMCLFQSVVASCILEGVLAAMVLCAVAHSVLRPKAEIPPRDPGSVAGDVVSPLAQSGGGGYMATGTLAAMHTGEKIVIFGLFVQLLFFGFFMAASSPFHARVQREPTGRGADPGVEWRKHFFVLVAASLSIFVRSVFRVIEYVSGDNGYLLKHEVLLYVFDACLVLAVMVLFNGVHPSKITEKLGKGYADTFEMYLRTDTESNV